MPKLLIIARAADRDLRVLFRIKVVSSAYWLILISVLLTEIPFMFRLHLIAFAKISTDSMKRYGERGQPCLTPLCGLKKLLDHPMFRTQLSVLLQNVGVQFIKKGPKPKY